MLNGVNRNIELHYNHSSCTENNIVIQLIHCIPIIYMICIGMFSISMDTGCSNYGLDSVVCRKETPDIRR